MSSDRIALVTGAGANVGRAISLRLAADGVAGTVVVNDVDEGRAEAVAAEVREAGAKAVAHVADITDWAAVTAMFDAVGPVDILVNNAGLPVSFARPKKFADTQPEDWAPWINLNLFGTMHVTRAAIPHMISAGWGRVITIVSDAGRVGEPRLAAYAAGKAGASAFMRSLAKEVGALGITCNNVALGTMRSGVAQLTEDQIKGLLTHYMVPRLGEPEDPAGLVAYLAGDGGSWITGQTISVNGGYSVTL